MRTGRIGSGLPQLGDIRRKPPRFVSACGVIGGSQFGRKPVPGTLTNGEQEETMS
jgi:hypothetical protein